MPLSVHLVFADSLCAAPDVCAAVEPEPGACVGVWLSSCCENRRESASRAISLHNHTIIRCRGLTPANLSCMGRRRRKGFCRRLRLSGAMQCDLENVALLVDSVPEFVRLARLKLHGLAADAADWPAWDRRVGDVWHLCRPPDMDWRRGADH